MRSTYPAGWSTILPVILLLAACETTPAPEELPPAPADLVISAPAIDPVLLHELLDQAEVAIAREHFTYPEAGSAYTIYKRILQLQPDQKDALRGMENIVEHHIARSLRALERSQYAAARSMLARARIIDPKHPSIEPTDAQIRLLSKAQREKLTLSQQQLKQRDADTLQALQDLARAPSNSTCRFTISAGSDAQGRWIYQSLSEGSEQTRIRAQIHIRLPATVERLCFPA